MKPKYYIEHYRYAGLGYVWLIVKKNKPKDFNAEIIGIFYNRKNARIFKKSLEEKEMTEMDNRSIISFE